MTNNVERSWGRECLRSYWFQEGFWTPPDREALKLVFGCVVKIIISSLQEYPEPGPV